MLWLIEHFAFGMVVLVVVNKFSTTHVSHRPHVHLRRMSKKAGEELKNARYSFTNLTSLPISISANTRKKQKMIEMNCQPALKENKEHQFTDKNRIYSESKSGTFSGPKNIMGDTRPFSFKKRGKSQIKGNGEPCNYGFSFWTSKQVVCLFVFMFRSRL